MRFCGSLSDLGDSDPTMVIYVRIPASFIFQRFIFWLRKTAKSSKMLTLSPFPTPCHHFGTWCNHDVTTSCLLDKFSKSEILIFKNFIQILKFSTMELNAYDQKMTKLSFRGNFQSVRGTVRMIFVQPGAKVRHMKCLFLGKSRWPNPQDGRTDVDTNSKWWSSFHPSIFMLVNLDTTWRSVRKTSFNGCWIHSKGYIDIGDGC